MTRFNNAYRAKPAPAGFPNLCRGLCSPRQDLLGAVQPSLTTA